MVMAIGARKKDGLVIAARSFGGRGSNKHDRTVVPEHRTTHNVISRSACTGCQQVGQIAQQLPRVKRVIIITSSKVIADGVNKVFEWFNDGFPNTLPGGLTKQDRVLLHHKIKSLEDKGIAVQAWETKPEFMVEACSRAWNRFLDLDNAPINEDPNNSACHDCIIKKQLTEIEYAKTGVACCPCAHSLSLIAKNLKRVDKFVITNIAGVTEPTLTMEVDGGSTFRHPGTSSA